MSDFSRFPRLRRGQSHCGLPYSTNTKVSKIFHFPNKFAKKIHSIKNSAKTLLFHCILLRHFRVAQTKLKLIQPTRSPVCQTLTKTRSSRCCTKLSDAMILTEPFQPARSRADAQRGGGLAQAGGTLSVIRTTNGQFHTKGY